MISYVLPTRDRPERLKATLVAIGRLTPHDAEVIIVDNDSAETLILPSRLPNGVGLRLLRRPTNEAAAARTQGVRASDPASGWIVMLDDDSHPVDTGVLDVLAEQPESTAAVAADIVLPAQGVEFPAFGAAKRMRRESGGLPEVFIGCGVAIRRSVYLDVGGYDPSFHYYAEEYDLSARLLLAGYRVAYDPRFVVHHHKDAGQRDMNLILSRLVRNNGWVAQRYAPERRRLALIRETRSRYRQIAEKEHALAGFASGLLELRRSIRRQPRTPMPVELFDRFTGLAAARDALRAAYDERPFASAALLDHGKNAWAVREALEELGVRITGEGEDAEVHVIATLSPGPMLDAFARRCALRRCRGPRVLLPWLIAASVPVRAAA